VQPFCGGTLRAERDGDRDLPRTTRADCLIDRAATAASPAVVASAVRLITGAVTRCACRAATVSNADRNRLSEAVNVADVPVLLTAVPSDIGVELGQGTARTSGRVAIAGVRIAGVSLDENSAVPSGRQSDRLRATRVQVAGKSASVAIAWRPGREIDAAGNAGLNAVAAPIGDSESVVGGNHNTDGDKPGEVKQNVHCEVCFFGNRWRWRQGVR